MPEQGVSFNAESMPPAEYLMRRSWNSNDAAIPGSVVRLMRCIKDGTLYMKDKLDQEPSQNFPAGYWCPKCGGPMDVAAVDVPLVKTNGKRWR